MKKVYLKHLSILFLALSSHCINAKDVPLLDNKTIEKIESLREKALTSPLGYQILESLTTEVGARMAGSPQDTLAVNWAVKKFESLGFDKVWKEPVTFKSWKRGIETAEIISPFPQQLKITALGGSIGTDKRGLVGELVQFPDLEALKEVSKKQVAGKIVFISNQMQRFKNGRGYGPAVAARSQGAVEASKKGAKAIIIRSIGTDSHRVTHTGMMRYQKGITKIPAAALSNPDADQLERIFKKGYAPTIKLNIGAHNDEEFTSYNVIGEMTGSNRAEEVIVIGGHLDSWDLGTGAIDDGAGVALTMAAATLIKQSKLKLKRTIRVVLWANEEQGLIGAKAYAAKHEKDLNHHIIGAESDFGAGKIYQFSTLFKEQDKPFIHQLKKVFRPLGIKYYNNQAGPESDLYPLFNKGMSVFKLDQNGIDYFDLHHTEDDTLDKVDPAAFAQNVAAYTVFAAMMAQYEGQLKRPAAEKVSGKK